MEEGLSYCADAVRQHDPDRFLTVLFAPPARREALFALYAFNVEVAKIREVVSEPMLGEIRLQWWREAIEGAYAGTPRRHAVVEPLCKAIQAENLTRKHFDRLIEARALDLGEEPPDTMERLTAYAEGTSGTLIWLAHEVLGGGDATRGVGRDIGRDVGIAWALTGLLRALPYHLRAKRVYLPVDMIERHGVAMRDLMELRGSDAIRRAVADIAAEARKRLQSARRLRATVPRRALPALLVARLADIYLRKLGAVGYDPFDSRLAVPAPFKGLRLWGGSLLGRF